jgi:hypothetical protein
MVHLIPDEMKPAAMAVRRMRSRLPGPLARRNRMLVRIRNSAIATAVGLAIWLPVAIARYTPRRFLSALPGYLVLTLAVAGILWFLARRTRSHAVDVLDVVAEEDPEMVPDLVRLMSLPDHRLLFGPWYPVAYAPKRLERWAGRMRAALDPRR